EYGAGAIDIQDSSPTIHNCVLTQNHSVYYSAISMSGSAARISNCTINDNDGSTSGYGAITCSDGSRPEIVNCLLEGNRATWHGGIACYWGSNATIRNCTIVGNTARYFSGGVYCHNSSPIVRNCVSWGHDAPSNLDVYIVGSSRPDIDYCIVEHELPAGAIDG